MTPKEIQAAALRLAAEIGPQARVYPSVTDYGHPLSLTVYRDGIMHDMTFRVEADEWAELFENAATRWDECKARVNNATITQMALEIIRITSERGECTDAALRGTKYSQEDLERFGSLACAKANEMAAGGPFAIVEGAKANAA